MLVYVVVVGFLHPNQFDMKFIKGISSHIKNSIKKSFGELKNKIKELDRFLRTMHTL